MSKVKLDGAPRTVIVTIDGAAGAGKSTTAKEVARRLGFRHLDSGALYRGVTFGLLARSGRASDGSLPPHANDGVDWSTVTRDQVDDLGIEVRWAPGGMEVWTPEGPIPDDVLRSAGVTRWVSAVSALGPVRSWLLDIQRGAAQGPGLVADGRDMGSVVFPNADLKVFLKADEAVRARRRLMQRGSENPTSDQVAAESARIAARDETDAGRTLSPLQIPEGALIIDTTALDFEEQVSEIVKRGGAWRARSQGS